MTDVKLLKDNELLALSIHEPKAFEELVDRHEAAFLRKAVSVLRDENEASDVVQETFVRIYIGAKKFKVMEGASFLSWAYKILTNQCYTHYKKLTQAKKFTLPLSPEAEEIIADASVDEEEKSKFTREHALYLISRLPLLLKRVTHLHFIDGLPQKDIAEKEGVTPEVIRTRIHRAKKIMKKYLYSYAA